MSRPTAYRGTGPYLFVCYSHADERDVLAEIAWLNNLGFDVWYDEGISPGHQWHDDLARAIDNCTKVVFFVSPSAVASPHCVDEVYYALDVGKPILTVHLVDTRVSGGLRLAVGSKQAIVKTNYSADHEYRTAILAALREPDRPAAGSDIRGRAPSVDAPRSKAEERSLAVLPFVNVTADPEMDYLCDGIADELIVDLSNLQSVRVVAGSSSFRFRGVTAMEAGRQLGVANVLEGRIHRSGDRLRVSAQLVDVAEGTTLWSGRSDAATMELLDLQDHLARQVLMALRIHLTSEQRDLLVPGTDCVPAYNAYLVAKHERSRLTRDALERSTAAFRQAVTHDPHYVAAHYGLWEALDYKGRRFGEREAAFTEQRTIIRTLRELDPQRNLINWTYVDRYMASRGLAELDMDETEQMFRQMFLDGKSLATHRDRRECWFRYGMLLAKAGYFEAGRAYLEHAHANNPMDEFIQFRLGELDLALGDTPRGIDRLARAIEINPRYLEPAIDILIVHCRDGNVEEAHAAADRIAPAFDGDLNRLVDGLLAHAKRQSDRAVAILDSLEERGAVPPIYKGFCWLLFGDVERSARWIDVAWRQGDEIATEIRLVRTRMATEATWRRALRSPTFRQVLNATGLSEEWCEELGRRARTLASVTGVDVGIRVS
jgi:TolB-like protein